MKKLITMVVILITTLFSAPFAFDVKGSDLSTVVIDPSGLPNRLPIGDELTVRNYIVGKNNLQMNVWVDLGYDNNGDWVKASCGKATPGYDSYQDCINDTTNAGASILEVFNISTNRPPAGKDMYAILVVTYFNDMTAPPTYAGGLFIAINVGLYENITPNTFRDAFAISSVTVTKSERVTIPIPKLQQLFIAVDTPEGAKTYYWSNSIVKSTNWPSSPTSFTGNGYVILNPWFCVGEYPARITITTTNGFTATYTQKGDKLTQPRMSMSDNKNLGINVPRGSNVKIYSSTDLNNWTLLSTSNSVETNDLRLPVSGDGRTFYRATCE